jgi:hypothetical protein
MSKANVVMGLLAASAVGFVAGYSVKSNTLPAENQAASVVSSSSSITAGAPAKEMVDASSVVARVDNKSFPAIFQAWNPLDMPSKYPATTDDEFLKNAAKHSLLWEEPVSQLGFNTKLVLGLVWDHKHAGLANSFTAETLAHAKENKKKLLAMNPNMVLLFEVRWRDAPGSYLPEDSEFWLRGDDGARVKGWDGGPEPYYMLNYKNEAFQQRLGEQARAVMASGVYDGVMLDWSGYLPVVKKVREGLGETGLLTVNIHDEIHKAEEYKDYINGAFMECAPDGRKPGDPKKLCTWASMAESLKYYEANFRKPTVNALEAWGVRSDLQAMRAVTTLGLTHSNGYVLFADPNPLPTPDHMHDWYDFWDANLGKAIAEGKLDANGSYSREFTNGTVVYNPETNKPVQLEFNEAHKAVSTGKLGTIFEIAPKDGEIFIKM